MNTAYTQGQIDTIRAARIEADAEGQEDDPSLFQTCLVGLMDGEGASEDHALVKAELAKLPLSPAVVKLVHAALVNSIKTITVGAKPAERNIERDALMYVYGKIDISNWQEIVDEQLTPPWPLECHLNAMGLQQRTAPVAGPDLQPLHNLLYLAQRQTSLGAMQRVVGEARLELSKLKG